jgi:hypothetical protein
MANKISVTGYDYEAQHDWQPGLNADAKKVAEILESICRLCGWSPRDVFSDFVAITEASYRMLPLHLESASLTGKVLDDPPDVADLWTRTRDKYRPHATFTFSKFCEARTVLEKSAQYPDGSLDFVEILGPLYTIWAEAGNKARGQYFTPQSLTRMMAMMALETDGKDIPTIIRQHLAEAFAREPFLEPLFSSLLLIGDAFGAESQDAAFDRYILPLVARNFEPIKVLDPCVGAGAMLISAAEFFPANMIRWGWVQFYGMDIDPLCAQMTRVNIMLRGLNGYGARLYYAAHLRELKEAGQADMYYATFRNADKNLHVDDTNALAARLPEPYHTAYAEAHTAETQGDTHTLELLSHNLHEAHTLRSMDQLSIFTDVDEAELQPATIHNLTSRARKAKPIRALPEQRALEIPEIAQ